MKKFSAYFWPNTIWCIFPKTSNFVKKKKKKWKHLANIFYSFHCMYFIQRSLILYLFKFPVRSRHRQQKLWFFVLVVVLSEHFCEKKSLKNSCKEDRKCSFLRNKKVLDVCHRSFSVTSAASRRRKNWKNSSMSSSIGERAGEDLI